MRKKTPTSIYREVPRYSGEVSLLIPEVQLRRFEKTHLESRLSFISGTSYCRLQRYSTTRAVINNQDGSITVKTFFGNNPVYLELEDSTPQRIEELFIWNAKCVVIMNLGIRPGRHHIRQIKYKDVQVIDIKTKRLSFESQRYLPK